MPQPTIVISEPPSGDEARSSWLRPELVASWWEIAAVLLLALGQFIYGGYSILVRRLSGARLNLLPTDYHALHLLAEESAILGLLLVYLHWRGWTPKDLRIFPSWRGVPQAVSLALANYAVFLIGGFFVFLSHHRPIPLPVATLPLHTHPGHLGWTVLIVWQAINAISEEVICMSYAFNQLAAKRGPSIALAIMLLLRASYHTWKSPAFLLITVVAFSLYGLLYWRTKNVWPLVLGHFLYDMAVTAHDIR